MKAVALVMQYRRANSGVMALKESYVAKKTTEIWGFEGILEMSCVIDSFPQLILQCSPTSSTFENRFDCIKFEQNPRSVDHSNFEGVSKFSVAAVMQRRTFCLSSHLHCTSSGLWKSSVLASSWKFLSDQLLPIVCSRKVSTKHTM